MANITNLVIITNIFTNTHTITNTLDKIDIIDVRTSGWDITSVVISLIVAGIMWYTVRKMAEQNKLSANSIESTKINTQVSLLPILEKSWEIIENYQQEKWQYLKYIENKNISQVTNKDIFIALQNIIVQDKEYHNITTSMNNMMYIYKKLSNKQCKYYDKIHEQQQQCYEILHSLRFHDFHNSEENFNRFIELCKNKHKENNTVNTITNTLLSTIKNLLITTLNLYTGYHDIIYERYDRVDVVLNHANQLLEDLDQIRSWVKKYYEKELFPYKYQKYKDILNESIN